MKIILMAALALIAAPAMAKPVYLTCDNISLTIDADKQSVTQLFDIEGSHPVKASTALFKANSITWSLGNVFSYRLNRATLKLTTWPATEKEDVTMPALQCKIGSGKPKV